MNPKAIVEVDFRGKKVPARIYGDNQYLEVATKVELAHAEGGFSEVHHEILQVPDEKGIIHTAVKIGIEIKGKVFYGTAQIKWLSQLGADKNDPIENAETSARGRALAAAGYEIGTMSSADDMDRVVESNGHTVVETALVLPEGLNWQEWAAREAKAKGITDKDKYLQMLFRVTEKRANYTTADYQKVVEYLYRLPDPKPVAIESNHETVSE